MTPGVQVLLSGALTFGVPLLLAARELVALKQPRNDRGGFDGPREDAPKPPIPGGQPRAPQLPACLIDAARIDAVAVPAKTTRVLEPI
jgi:hypothetical protein